MGTLLADLFPEGSGSKTVRFHPASKYIGPIDAMLYVREDVSYRADRVDPFLTVLWHPTEERLVGVKLKGFRFVFDRLMAIVPDLNTGHFVPFVQALETAMTAGLGEALTDRIEQSRRLDRYKKAREFVVEFDVKIPAEELPKAA